MRALRAAWLLSAMTVSCARVVVDDLDAHEAGRAIAALDRVGVAAKRSDDDRHANRFAIEVDADDVSISTTILSAEEIPPRRDEAPADEVAPTIDAARAVDARSRARAIERTIASAEDVVGVDVALALPEPSAGAREDEAADHGHAVVVVRHHGATSPFTNDQLRALVATQLPRATSRDVVIIDREIPWISIDPDRTPARLGPWTTTRAGLPKLRATLAILLGVVAMLGASLAALAARAWAKRART